VWAKPGNKDWVYLSDDTIADAYGYFNISTCAAGTMGAGVTSSNVDSGYSGGWCRVGILFTATVAAHTLRFETADADSDHSVVGDDATVNTYWWGFQVTAPGVVNLGSYNPTTTASVTRNADLLSYSPTSNFGETTGTIVATVAHRNIAMNTATYYLTLSDATTANQMPLLQNATGDVAQFLVTASSVNSATITGTTDLDAAEHIIAAQYTTNLATLYVDSVSEGTPDTSVTIPTGITKINAGSSATQGSAYTHGVIKKLSLYDVNTVTTH
jgi:hypothetical protein